MKAKKSIYLLIDTIKYLKTKQIFSYLNFYLKRYCLNKIIARRILKLNFNYDPANLVALKKPLIIHRHNLLGSSFSFLNKKYKFKKEIQWNYATLTKLWLYHLHYFDYIISSSDYEDENIYQLSKKIINSWIENNPIGYGNGWEPYPISLRIINWIFFYHFFHDQISRDANFKSDFLQSLYKQCVYLTHFIEYHLQANHLFKNGKALFVAGLFFQEKRWQIKGEKILIHELEEQILEDGGHFEQSPMYHSITLEDVLDLINFLPDQNNRKSKITHEYLTKKAAKMLDWLSKVNQPDGEIPLFGDSAHNTALSFRQLRKYFEDICKISYKEPKCLHAEELADTGYFVFRTTDQYLVIDGGKLGPEYQPGHAHCDLFSFEYSHKKKRFIVDTGLGEYLNTDIRQKARGIEGHNTVIVNEMQQAEIWQTFRMGERVYPEKTEFLKNEQNLEFRGKYKNDLVRSKKYEHTRKVTLLDRAFFKIDDVITATNIESIYSNLHIHPDCEIEISNDSIRLRNHSTTVYIIYDHDVYQAELLDWFYCPEFGIHTPSKKIQFHAKEKKINHIWYLITPEIFQKNARKYLDKYHIFI